MSLRLPDSTYTKALHFCVSLPKLTPFFCFTSFSHPADELQRNLDRLMAELAATRQEVQSLSEELLALHEHADLETAQVRQCRGIGYSSCNPPDLGCAGAVRISLHTCYM